MGEVGKGTFCIGLLRFVKIVYILFLQVITSTGLVKRKNRTRLDSY